MFYIVSIKNIKTGDIATMKVFSPLEVGAVIGWGTDDGENTAQWVVEYCSLRTTPPDDGPPVTGRNDPAGIVAENQRRKIISEEANTMTINKTRYSSFNYKRLAPFLDAVRELPNQSFTFTCDGYEPLSIENLEYTFKGYPVWGMMHTYNQNGDTMRDPDMTFLVDRETGNIVPHTFQQDNCSFTKYGTLYQEVWEDETHWRPSLRAELDRFLKDWITNILDQGFKPDQAAENEVTPEQFAEAVTE